jgi:hypothetical protein
MRENEKIMMPNCKTEQELFCVDEDNIIKHNSKISHNSQRKYSTFVHQYRMHAFYELR